ncbi:MAG: hypothetical protein [Bacteriophage sp.]|nr:MAG: hypothetical protein [Bacteriophage sp.]
MENKEKFAFRKVHMNQDVEVEFIKLLSENQEKSDESLLTAFKDTITSDKVTCHADMLSRTSNLIIFQTSKFSRLSLEYKDYEIWVFSKSKVINLDKSAHCLVETWTLNRFRI